MELKNIPIKIKKKLGEFKKLKLKDNYFVICSDGQTATLWLAAALNNHPDIFCTHGYSYPAIGAESRDFQPDELIHRRQTRSRFWDLTLHEYFSELKAGTAKKIIGNVHGFTYARFMGLLPKYRAKPENLLIMNMIRHPVTRLGSVYSNWSPKSPEGKVNAFIEHDFTTRCSHILEFLKPHKLDVTSGYTKAFVVALLQQETIAQDVLRAKQNQVMNVVFEEVTANQNYLMSLIKMIGGENIDVPLEYLQSIYTAKPINKHNRSGDKSIHGQYSKWEDWQRAGFNFIFERNKMSQVYAEFGYDFSFKN